MAGSKSSSSSKKNTSSVPSKRKGRYRPPIVQTKESKLAEKQATDNKPKTRVIFGPTGKRRVEKEQ